MKHQTCMYQSKTIVTVKKCKHKNRNARTQTKMHDNRKSAQNGKSEQLENLNLRTKKSLGNTKCDLNLLHSNSTILTLGSGNNFM